MLDSGGFAREIYPIRPHRLVDIFNGVFTEIFVGEWQLIADRIVRCPGDTDPSGLCKSFQPRGDIDAVAIHLAAIDDDFTEVQADAKLNALDFGNCFVFFLTGFLKCDRAVKRIGHGREIRQHRIAGVVFHFTAMGFDRLGKEIEIGAEGSMGAGFVGTGEARITVDVGI